MIFLFIKIYALYMIYLLHLYPHILVLMKSNRYEVLHRYGIEIKLVSFTFADLT